MHVCGMAIYLVAYFIKKTVVFFFLFDANFVSSWSHVHIAMFTLKTYQPIILKITFLYFYLSCAVLFCVPCIHFVNGIQLYASKLQ